MVMWKLRVVKGSRVDDVIVGRVVERELELVENLAQDVPKIVNARLGDVLEVAGMGLGNEPGLERKPAGVVAKGREMGRIEHDPLLDTELLLNHVTEDAPSPIIIKLQRA